MELIQPCSCDKFNFEPRDISTQCQERMMVENREGPVCVPWGPRVPSNFQNLGQRPFSGFFFFFDSLQSPFGSSSDLSHPSFKTVRKYIAVV